MAACLIDVRCLQDPAYSDHPIGRHGRMLLQHALECLPGFQLIGLEDAALPRLQPGDRALLHDTRHTSYTGALTTPCCHVQLSPLTHDPLFVARLLHHPAIPSATVVHAPGAAAPGELPLHAGLDRSISLRWLARHQLFMPVSAQAATWLRDTLDVVNDRIGTSGADHEQGCATAVRFWDAVRSLAPHIAPSIACGRPKVALLTTLPPDRSKAAVASAALCASLGQRVELHLFTPTAPAATPRGAASVSPLSALPMLSSRFDRIVAAIDNAPSCHEILTLLLRYGGAAIQYDGHLIDLYAHQFGMDRTVALAEAELGRTLHGNEIWRWLAGTEPAKALIMGDLAASAEPLIMQSRSGIADVARRYDRQAYHLPASLPPSQALAPPGALQRQSARSRLGLEPHQVLVASFSAQAHRELAADAIWVLDILRSWGTDARLHLIATPTIDRFPLQQLIADLELAPYIRLIDGRRDAQAYGDHLATADVALHLHRGDETGFPGPLANCIAAGVPTVVPAGLVDIFAVPGFVRTIADRSSPVLVAEATMELLETASRSDRAAAAGEPLGDAATLCRMLGLA